MKVSFKNCGKGTVKDASPEELGTDVWSDSLNVRFRNGYAEKFRGLAQVFDSTTVLPNWLGYYEISSKRYFVHASAAKVFVDDGVTRTEITPTSAPTGSFDNRWSGGVYSGNLVMNNGVDVPTYWGGNVANDLVSLPGWNSAWRAQIIRPFKEYLLAFNVTKSSTNYPYMVKWSAAGVPGSMPSSWDETDLTKDAGEKDLSETTDLIVDALPFGDGLIVYKQRSMFQVSFIGQPYIFRFQRLQGSDGLMAPGCVTDTPVGHVFVSNGDVMLFNGSQATSIADGVVREYLFRNMSSDYYARSFVTTNPQKQEVLICYPEEGQQYCTKAAIWNWKTNTWAFRSLPSATYGVTGQISSSIGIIRWSDDSDSWDSDPSIWVENEYAANEARCLLSFTDKIGAFDIGPDDFGTTFSSYVEKAGMSLDDSQAMKLVRTVLPKFDSSGATMSVSVGSSDIPDATPTYATASDFVCGTDFKTDAMVNGRYIAVKFSNTSKTPWRIRSFDLDVVPAGVY